MNIFSYVDEVKSSLNLHRNKAQCFFFVQSCCWYCPNGSCDLIIPLSVQNRFSRSDCIINRFTDLKLGFTVLWCSVVLLIISSVIPRTPKEAAYIYIYMHHYIHNGRLRFCPKSCHGKAKAMSLMTVLPSPFQLTC